MGYLLALLSSASFGLIPLFSLPLLHGGMSAESVLFYRFLFGALILGGIVLVRRDPIGGPLPDLGRLAAMSALYMLAALLMFHGFAWLPSGVAATLQFLYPVIVMLIMVLFFHEKLRISTVCALLLALGGVFLLGGGTGDGGAVRPLGVTLLLLSALSNALYIVGLHVAKPRRMTGLAVTFWVLAFGALICLVNALAVGSFSLPASPRELLLAFLLAAVTAALSNLTLVLAVQRIGSTMTSVLGVLEPPTAVCVGILVFQEPSTASLWIGMALICLAVIAVMLGPGIGARAARFFRTGCRRPQPPQPPGDAASGG